MILVLTTKRVCSGVYERTDGRKTVTISRTDDGNFWNVAAKWNNTRYSDSLATKKDAIEVADMMIKGELEI